MPNIRSGLRDREFLSGSVDGGFPEFLGAPGDSFPLGLRIINGNQFSLGELSAKCMEYVQENNSQSPAIVFRGLPAKTAEDFLTITQAIKGKPLSYAGGNVPRPRAIENSEIYQATTEDQAVTIELHHEMAYSSSFPSKVFFFCLQEPADGCGGETPLAKSSEILLKLDPEVVRKFQSKGVKYAGYWPDKSHAEYACWQQQYYTDNKEEAEKKAKQLYDTVIWDDNGDMHWSNVKPAFLRHPKTGEDIWFNQVTIHHHTYYDSLPMFKSIELPPHKYPCTVYYGDGGTIEPEVIQHLRAVSWSCAVGFRWRKGDLLVLDNLTVQHGRIGFTGKREILVHLMTN